VERGIHIWERGIGPAGGKKEGEFLTANDANDAKKWQDHHHAEKALLHQASETGGEAADAATSKTPSRTAPNSEVLKGRNISAQGKLGTSAALGSDPKDEFALKGQQQVTSTEGNEENEGFPRAPGICVVRLLIFRNFKFSILPLPFRFPVCLV